MKVGCVGVLDISHLQFFVLTWSFFEILDNLLCALCGIAEFISFGYVEYGSLVVKNHVLL